MQRISTWYDWGLLAPALLPLFYVSGMMYPMLSPKTFALRTFGIIVLALFAYLVASGRPFFFERLRTWATWLPAALLLVAYLASFFGTDFYHSFWSTFERGDGLLTLTVCVGYFYLILLSAGEGWLSRLGTIVAWVGSLAAVYLVLQWLQAVTGIDLPFIVAPNGRVGGTMGNAAFLASYLGMVLPVTLAAASGKLGKVRALLFAGAALEIVAIILTATRGTMLALFATAFVALLYLAFGPETRLISRKSSRVVLAGLLIVAGLFIAFRGELARVPFEPIRRAASASFSDVTVASRLAIWRNVSREAISQHPLLGYGAEHIDIPFDRTYDPSRILEEWFDRSHNAYLDYFVQFGVGGALLYFSLIALLLYKGIRRARGNDIYGYALVGTASIYAMQNFFVFDTAMTLWLFLALAAAALARDATSRADTLFAQSRPAAGAIIALVLLVLLVPVVVQPVRANLLAFEAYQYQVVDVARASAAAEKALALGTYADLELGYNAYFMYTEEQANRLAGEDLAMAYENAANLLTRNFHRYPYDVRTAVYLAQVLASAPDSVAADTALLSEAISRSIAESPKRSQPWYLLANLSIGEANKYPLRSPERVAGYAAAKDVLGAYIALVPRLATPHFVLAQLELAGGNRELAAAEAAKGRALYTSNLEAARRAVAYYESVEDFESAEFFLEEIVEIAPHDVDAVYELAKVKFIRGDKAGAAALVEQLRVSAPAIIDTDPAFKAAITAYERSLP